MIVISRHILYISQETLRFGELKLRMLEEYGVVHREVYREVPPKVEYLGEYCLGVKIKIGPLGME